MEAVRERRVTFAENVAQPQQRPELHPKSAFSGLLDPKLTLPAQAHSFLRAFAMLMHNADVAALVSEMAKEYMWPIANRMEDSRLRLKIWISNAEIKSAILRTMTDCASAEVDPDVVGMVRAAFEILRDALDDMRENVSRLNDDFEHIKIYGYVVTIVAKNIKSQNTGWEERKKCRTPGMLPKTAAMISLQL